MILDFAEQLRVGLKNLPGYRAQFKMAPQFREHPSETKRFHPNARKSGVLVLFYPVQKDIKTILIQRPKYDGVHSKQVAFPGGAMEEADSSLIDTALREANEEVGINTDQVEVLGNLTELYVPPSNFLISPVVGYSLERPEFKIDPFEVAETIEIDISILLDDSIVKEKTIHVREDVALQAPYFEIDGRTVWGATAMMLSELKEILKIIEGH